MALDYTLLNTKGLNGEGVAQLIDLFLQNYSSDIKINVLSTDLVKDTTNADNIFYYYDIDLTEYYNRVNGNLNIPSMVKECWDVTTGEEALGTLKQIDEKTLRYVTYDNTSDVLITLRNSIPNGNVEVLSNSQFTTMNFEINGDGVNNSWTFTHGKNTRSIIAKVLDENFYEDTTFNISYPTLDTIKIESTSVLPVGKNFTLDILVQKDEGMITYDITGDDSTTEWTFTHGKKTRNLFVRILDSTTYEEVKFGVSYPTLDTIKIESTNALGTGNNFIVNVFKR